MSRYRNLAVLVIVIAAQLVLLAYQVRTKDDVSLLRSATVTAVSPLAKALMKKAAGEKAVLHAPGGVEHLKIVDVSYEEIPMDPFDPPPGAQSAPKTEN